ncbi:MULTISPECIES: hypothetical protein [Vibrio]|uniref:hypothetical protein n=1 Tax=Vibrio TaxID=662 RepID=UPI001112F6F3|nr:MULTISPECIES: hypothetical protein [Vibrio]EJI1280446.1 hypothetical protein [Vibrio vulnificus]MCR9500914.1 hypothetical protein [Vibrio vulnificus]
MFGLFSKEDDKKLKCAGCGKSLNGLSVEVKGGSKHYCSKSCMVKYVRRMTGQKD